MSSSWEYGACIIITQVEVQAVVGKDAACFLGGSLKMNLVVLLGIAILFLFFPIVRQLLGRYGNSRIEIELGDGAFHGPLRYRNEKLAEEHYLRALRFWNTKAHERLGTLYLEGSDVRDFEKAWYHLHAAWEHGHFQALIALSGIYHFGRYVERDDERAFKLAQIALQMGIWEAQVNLGYCYANGFGVEQDPAKALECYQACAQRGLPEAQFNVGQAYMQGKGTAEDHLAGVKWLRLAARQGYAPARTNLNGNSELAMRWSFLTSWVRAVACREAEECQQVAICYRAGHGVRRNLTRAESWYRRAIARGSLEGHRSLGWLLINHGAGEGARERGLDSYRAGAREGSVDCMLALAAELADADDSEAQREAVQWLDAAIERGSLEAKIGKSHLYSEGKCLDKDEERSLALIREAAEAGSARAQGILGSMLVLGKGIEKDELAGAQLLRAGADQGDPAAQEFLAWCYEAGAGVEQSDLEALMWYQIASTGRQGGMIGCVHLQDRLTRQQVREATDRTIAWFTTRGYRYDPASICDALVYP